MTQPELAKKGTVSSLMAVTAAVEGVAVEVIASGLADGTIVLPANSQRKVRKPCAIGKGLRTKINANIGTSQDFNNIQTELEKLRISEKYQSDTIMDLSTGGDISAIRKAIIKESSIPLGTVPIYQAAVRSIEKHSSIVAMEVDDLFSCIEEQVRDGVDFITVHCGITQSVVEKLKRQGRVTNVVSRGGAFLIGWMLYHQKENPLYEYYDRLLEIAHRYDVTLSLGDGLRPGSLADATDRAQIEELITLGELVDRARKAGVQAMVEGPGHVPLNQIVTNIQLQKSLCKGAPFYVLGPLVTDIAAGYDHITAAIGGALAASAGADFLCYVTPSEHLGLPGLEDVREGVIASRIAAHAADLAKGVKGAWEWDREMSEARRSLNWEKQASLSLDPEKARKTHAKLTTSGESCSMCSEYCAMALMEKYLGITAEKC